MTTIQAIKFAGGTTVSLAKLLGVSSAAISQWGKHPPRYQQLLLKELSDGLLKPQAFITKVGK